MTGEQPYAHLHTYLLTTQTQEKDFGILNNSNSPSVKIGVCVKVEVPT